MSRETASISLHHVTKIEIDRMKHRDGSVWQNIGIHQRIDGKDTLVEIAMFLPDGVSVLPINMVDDINGDD
jgi:hypothetical protein